MSTKREGRRDSWRIGFIRIYVEYRNWSLICLKTLKIKEYRDFEPLFWVHNYMWYLCRRMTFCGVLRRTLELAQIAGLFAEIVLVQKRFSLYSVGSGVYIWYLSSTARILRLPIHPYLAAIPFDFDTIQNSSETQFSIPKAPKLIISNNSLRTHPRDHGPNPSGQAQSGHRSNPHAR